MSGTTEGGKKTAEAGRGNPEKASPAAIEKYLKGIHFPAKKSDLLSEAKKNNAPNDVISVLNRFGDKDYNSAIDVSKEVGKID